MRIVKVDQFRPKHRTRLVRITIDNGLTGWGETTLEGKPHSTWAAVEELSDYLVGKDPLRIEHHWQHIYRSAFFRGGNVLMSALAGIDQALWDVAGKFYGVPAYKLMGNSTRDKIRVHAHWGIRTSATRVSRGRASVLIGFRRQEATRPSRRVPPGNGEPTSRHRE